MYKLDTLTLDEKIGLLCGVDNWHTSSANGQLPSLHLSDGPSGLRKIDEDGKTVPSTVMPTLSCVANTWSRECAYLDGATIADACIENDVDVLLAPGVNIKRTPLCGRNFEYFSEDPYLAGELAYEFISGAQDKGVGVSLKHYLANNTESDRLFKNSEIDERTLREIYLVPFERAIEAKPYTVMCSYNLVNGVFASESKKYLDTYLRSELGHDGVIISDWGACRAPYRSLLASLDLVMPKFPNHAGEIKRALELGYITEADIDKCAERMLSLIEKCQHKSEVTMTSDSRHENALKIAKEGIVLLKNEGALPLTHKKITVAGALAKSPVINGGGSAEGKSEYEIIPLYDLLKQKLPESSIEPHGSTASPNGYLYRAQSLYRQAYSSDAVVLCLGTERTESECVDRRRIRLSEEQESLIINTAKHNKNTIVVIYAGSAVDMSAWIDKVNACVLAGYAGEGVNEALASILSGEISPSGKLSESFPLRLDDVCAELNVGRASHRYTEGVFVGYRYYDTYGVDVLFPFGHGLSYAKFEYSGLSVTPISDTEFDVSYDITNTSDIDASEVSQIYVKDVFCPLERPEKELKGFSKDFIRAHEKKRVTVRLSSRSFAYYNTALERWYVENGDFEIMVGASVADIRLTQRLSISLPEDTQATSME